MKIKLLVVGKTNDKNLQVIIDSYQKRLKHYINFEIQEIPALKNTKSLSKTQQKTKEGQLILKSMTASNALVLLDEKGKMFKSAEFATYLQKRMNSGLKKLVFVIGGPYGFSDEVYKRASEKISFSKMTFSHQMIRLFAIEQIYRAFTILKNEPYHHE